MYDNIKNEYKVESLSLIKERLEDKHYSFLNTTNFVRPQANHFLKSLRGSIVSKIQLYFWQATRLIYRKIKK